MVGIAYSTLSHWGQNSGVWQNPVPEHLGADLIWHPEPQPHKLSTTF